MSAKTTTKMDFGSIRSTLFWVLPSAAIAFALAAIFSALIVSGAVDVRFLNAAAYFCCAVGAFAGAHLAARKAAARKVICALIVGVGFVLILLIGNLLIPEAKPSGFGIITGLLLGAALLGGMLANRRGKRGGYRRK